MDREEERRCAGLSPFELKNRLIDLAKHRGERLMLNAGRGNPNWVALEPRGALVLLGEFALGESQTVSPAAGFGGLPRRRGIAARLRGFLAMRTDRTGAELLRRGVDHAVAAFGLDSDRLVGEWADGVLGDHYPLPVRMLEHAQVLVRAHLVEQLLGGDAEAGRLDLFAVEGASAGITYVFQSLLHSQQLRPGDRIALGVPIFTPYLELPCLPEFGFDTVEVAQDETAGWRYPAAEIDKLRDPQVKAFLAVNPSNPTGVAMDASTLERIGRIAAERPELILITDDVYAPFVEGFRSIATVAPRQTILLYSFSKFWGATGLRLGVVALHESNRLDERLGAATGEMRAAASERYRTISTAPEHLKFIDRLVADSRGVGLNHTAGLSTPQQVQMALFALDALLDTGDRRRRTARALVQSRFEALLRGAGLELQEDALHSRYYASIDIPALARTRYGAPFADWLLANFEPIDFVVRLAEERGIVLLDGGGFDAPRMSVRVSLANLPDEAYEPIGRGIGEQLADYHAQWLDAGARDGEASPVG